MNSMSVNSVVTFSIVVDTPAAGSSTEAADTPDIAVGCTLVGSTAADSTGVADIGVDIEADTEFGTAADGTGVADTEFGTEADIVAGRLVGTPADKSEADGMPAVAEHCCAWQS